MCKSLLFPVLFMICLQLLPTNGCNDQCQEQLTNVANELEDRALYPFLEPLSNFTLGETVPEMRFQLIPTVIELLQFRGRALCPPLG